MGTIDRGPVEDAYALLGRHIRITPLLRADGADFGLSSFPLTLKLEQLQHAGSFKARGAFAQLLMREIPDVGVVAASGGNHGAAVAFAAMRLGVRAKVFVPLHLVAHQDRAHPLLWDTTDDCDGRARSRKILPRIIISIMTRKLERSSEKDMDAVKAYCER